MYKDIFKSVEVYFKVISYTCLNLGLCEFLSEFFYSVLALIIFQPYWK